MLKINFIHIYLCCFKISKGYSSNSSNISDYITIFEITSIQNYTRLAQNRLPKQKILGNDRMETAIQQSRQFDVETTLKNPRVELIDILSILKVKTTSKSSRWIDVIISTCNCFSKSMKSRRTFHVEFRRRIDGESTKMCLLGWEKWKEQKEKWSSRSNFLKKEKLTFQKKVRV